MNLPIKSHTSLRKLFFDEILVSNYHDCKGEAINLIPHYVIDINYKTVKPSHLEKLQNIQNINNLILQVFIFIFSEWILIEQIIFFPPLISAVGENKFCPEFWSFEWGIGAWVKMPRFNTYSRNAITIN